MADVIEINVATGERVERAFTKQEKSQREADRVAFEQVEADRVQAEETRAALRASAEAKLKKLGLTLDEIATVLS